MSSDEALAMVKSDGVEENINPKFTLEFVNVGAVSQAEKERNQRLIRSTAMRSFRRRQQSERSLKGEGSSKDSERAKRQPKSLQSDDKSVSPMQSTDLSSKTTFSEVSWLMGGKSNDQKADYFAFVDSNRRGSSSTQSSSAPSVVESPATPLGAGRVDPFRMLPVESSSHINELIDHSVIHLWPGLRPRRSDGSESKISSAWLEKVYERPVVMHALLFGAAVHMDVLRSPRLSLDNPVRLYHKVQTMRLIKEELKSPEKTPLDEVLLAVLCLAANEIETVANHMKKKIRSPFNSPLTSAQWLDVYGSITHIPAHTIAMRSLVNRRGGLERINLEGLAEVLSFSDILGATQKLSKPHWPLLDRTMRSKLEIPKPAVRTLGKGFQDLISFGINDKAVSVLSDMADLTMVIDDHCRGSKLIPNITVLIDHRNTVQHNLLSLPTGDEFEHGQVANICLYESIRLAAIIYSAAVIFPLPPITGIFRKFECELKAIMEESKLDPCWQLCPKVLLWILILGGISATGTPERCWYIQNLSTLSSALSLSEWDEVAEELEEYLWLESACDAGGQLLWIEVMNERALKDFDSSESPEF